MQEFFKFNGERGTHVNIEANAEDLGWGKESVVERVNVTVLGGDEQTKTISLAEKLLREKDPDARRQSMKKIIEAHHRLQEAGIPTFPTMRMDDGNPPRLLLTDLSREGKYTVVSVPDFWGPRGEIEAGKLHDHHIFNLSNPDNVSTQLKRIFERASNEGIIVIGIGAPFLDIDNETHEGHMLVGDLSKIRFDQKKNSLFVKTMNKGVWYTYCQMMNAHLDANSRLKMNP